MQSQWTALSAVVIAAMLAAGCAQHRGELVVLGAVVTVAGVAVTAKSIESYSPGSQTGTVGVVMVVTGLAVLVTGLASGPRGADPKMIRRR